MSDKIKGNIIESTASTTVPPLAAGQGRVYGFLLVVNEKDDRSEFSHIFAVDKKIVSIGRDSRSDIRMNAGLFSRLHATITITQHDGTLRVSIISKVHGYKVPMKFMNFLKSICQFWISITMETNSSCRWN